MFDLLRDKSLIYLLSEILSLSHSEIKVWFISDQRYISESLRDKSLIYISYQRYISDLSLIFHFSLRDNIRDKSEIYVLHQKSPEASHLTSFMELIPKMQSEKYQCPFPLCHENIDIKLVCPDNHHDRNRTEFGQTNTQARIWKI